MSVNSYRTLSSAVSADIEVKRSRFLADIAPVNNEDEARAVIENARKVHWDARHHCSAFVLQPDAAVRRSNDDGEPSGTAGIPMLEVLTGEGLTDVVGVVTRWFGGTQLGTGGLVRAYGDAVREALSVARREKKIVTYERRIEVTTSVPVAEAGRIEHALRTSGVAVQNVGYGASDAVLTLAVAPDAQGRTESSLAELTGGRAALNVVGETWALSAQRQ